MKSYWQSKFTGSVMQAILWSVVAIVSLSIVTLMVSYTLTESGDQDALAINLAGSMRMQTLRIALEVQKGDGEALGAAVDRMDQKWRHPVFSAIEHEVNTPLGDAFRSLSSDWGDHIRPAIARLAAEDVQARDEVVNSLVGFVTPIDDMVSLLQRNAEQRVHWQRFWQVLALFLTVSLASYVLYVLRHRVQLPLAQLTRAAHRIGEGDFTGRIELNGNDELVLLGDTLNHTCDEIAKMYGGLERRVREKTEELRHSITTLEFLFDAARTTLEKELNAQDFQLLLDRLASLLRIKGIELCLFTDAGVRPYQQVVTSDCERACAAVNCDVCHVDGVSEMIGDRSGLRFPIARGEHEYGIMKVAGGSRMLEEWEVQLIRSVADQVALSLSARQQKEQERRLTLYQERSVIARELHDSLAQALSYLKIQVTRLQKAQDRGATDQFAPITEELREGLNSAYRQLRELLTTFRLKISGDGLRTALEAAVGQLRDQATMELSLDYQLQDVPLSATEEIHLMQIAREAAQNAVRHSQGSRVSLRLSQAPGKRVQLVVEDDGVGIPVDPEKLNHYGLAIMLERSRSLDGTLEITRREPHGTRVAFEFSPRMLAVSVGAPRSLQ